MATVTGPRSLAEVRGQYGDDTYPRYLLAGCETALILFAAAFWGRQDAWHIADAGIDGWCVDIDGWRLSEMKAVYPFGWQFITDDVFDYAERQESKWDIVSLDPFTNLFNKCAHLLPLWCSLARHAVILGCGPDTALMPPKGWQVTDRRWRSDFSGGVQWAVVERT